MKLLLLLAALCVISSAMVPRPRRAVNTEDQPQPSMSKHVCAKETPCGWIFYQRDSSAETHEDNPYCECQPGKICKIDEDDRIALTYIKKCKSPIETEKNEEGGITTESEKNAES